MTEKRVNPADTGLPKNPDIDRAALILFDGKDRERFDFTRAQAEDDHNIPDHGPIIGPIIHRTMNAIWPYSDVTEARSTHEPIEGIPPQAEGISQSILAAAAEANDLEPVSEAGGDDLPWDTPEFKAMMADRFDHLVDYWNSEGMPEGVEMKLRELLADETPDPALMKDVLFVIDADDGKARAVITDDGIRLEGFHSSYGLLGEATKLLPLILERERDRKLYATTTLAEAGKAIRYAIESGEDTDAAGELIEDLWRWLNGNPENPNIWINEGPDMDSLVRDQIKEGLAAQAAFSTEMEQHTCEDAAVKAALDTDDELRSMVGMKPGQATARMVDRFMDNWYAQQAAKFNPQPVMIDPKLTEEQVKSMMADEKPGEVLLLNHHSEALGQAFARAATMGTAWLHVTHGHAEGIQIKLVTPLNDMDPDVKVEPQDSDAPDGVAACDEGGADFSPAESAYIQARVMAQRRGAAILTYNPDNDRYNVFNPAYFKIGSDIQRDRSGRSVFFAQRRKNPKT